MPKTYFNDAIIGNSSVLGCLTGRGELIRLFWPHIDYSQHIEKMAAGVFFTDRTNSTLWFSDDGWQHSQRYIPDTNIVETVCGHSGAGIKVVQTDFVLPGSDAVVRRYRIENHADCESHLGFMLYSSAVTTTPDLRSTLFDFDVDALIHYRHKHYMSISADREVYQFQLGNNAFGSAGYTELNGFDSIGMMRDGAVSWKLGSFRGGEAKTFTLFICFSGTLQGVKSLARRMKGCDAGVELKNTEKFWQDYVSRVRYIDRIEKMDAIKTQCVGKNEVFELYKRSLLVFSLMSDKSGGLLAAPEVDEEFTRCGRYAYCWGRDAAFITGALDKCGLTAEVDRFYDWAVKTQDDNGVWHQRYHMDGNLAPSWGLQIDETGTLLWGMLEHYRVTRNKDFLARMWVSVKKAVEFLIGFMDEETGLPLPSYDLWEERVGEHTYSSAAVYGGIRAGVEIAGLLGEKGEFTGRWRLAADSLKIAVERKLWKPEWGRFLRSARTKLNPWGSEHTSDKTVIQVNPKGYKRDVTLEDGTVDVSLLGTAIPFGMFDVSDCKVAATAETIERVLTAHPAGGIKRYENDGYIGGNPWVIATLWVALYHIRAGNFKKALPYFEWSVKARTEVGLLPEQVDRDTGKPAWVIPLTWSHAMYVLVLTELLDAGALHIEQV